MKPIILVSSLGLVISNISHAQVACYNCGSDAPTCSELRDDSEPSHFNLKNVGERAINCMSDRYMQDVSVIISIVINNKNNINQLQIKNTQLQQNVNRLKQRLDDAKRQIQTVREKLKKAENSGDKKIVLSLVVT